MHSDVLIGMAAHVLPRRAPLLQQKRAWSASHWIAASGTKVAIAMAMMAETIAVTLKDILTGSGKERERSNEQR